MPRRASFLRRWRLRAGAVSARFRRSQDGLAILEFALILPILLLGYIGTIEVSNLLSASRKVDLLTRTIGEFVGSAPLPSQQDIDGVFKASQVVLLPFSGSTLEIVVSAVGVPSTVLQGPMTICSSVAGTNATRRSVGAASPVALAADQRFGGARMLLVETRMRYSPITGSVFVSLFGQVLSGIVFQRQVYWPVSAGLRYYSQAPEVVLPSGSPCPAS